MGIAVGFRTASLRTRSSVAGLFIYRSLSVFRVLGQPAQVQFSLELLQPCFVLLVVSVRKLYAFLGICDDNSF